MVLEEPRDCLAVFVVEGDSVDANKDLLACWLKDRSGGQFEVGDAIEEADPLTRLDCHCIESALQNVSIGQSQQEECR